MFSMFVSVGTGGVGVGSVMIWFDCESVAIVIDGVDVNMSVMRKEDKQRLLPSLSSGIWLLVRSLVCHDSTPMTS